MTVDYKGEDAPAASPVYVPGYGRWIGKIKVPADGDYNNGATFAPGYQGQVDRTVWLYHRTIDIVSGGIISNAPLQFNGDFIFAGEVNCDNLHCSDGSWVSLDPLRPWERHSLRLHTTSRQVADTSDADANLPDAWTTTEGGFRAIRTRQTELTTRYHEIEVSDLPDAAQLTSVAVITQGVSHSDNVIVAKFRLGRYKGSAAMEWLSADTDDDHNDVNYLTERTTTFTPTGGTHTVDKSYIYVVRVTHPTKTGGLPGNDLYIKDVRCSGTASRLGL